MPGQDRSVGPKRLIHHVTLDNPAFHVTEADDSEVMIKFIDLKGHTVYVLMPCDASEEHRGLSAEELSCELTRQINEIRGVGPNA